MILNHFTKRRQNGFKVDTRDKYMTHFEVGKLYSKLGSYLHNFFTIRDFPIQFSICTICPVQSNFELGKPVVGMASYLSMGYMYMTYAPHMYTHIPPIGIKIPGVWRTFCDMNFV